MKRVGTCFLNPIAVSLLFMVTAAGLRAPVAASQSLTFQVTVQNKTAEHPHAGQGWSEGYVVDGVQGREITLTRGVTYSFQMNDVPAIHPFYISTSAQGGGAGAYANGVSNHFATGNQRLIFTPPADAPDLLYYQCQTHELMGYRINLVSPPEAALVSVADGFAAPVALLESPDDTNRLFVVDQVGLIYVLENGTRRAEPFLDLRDRMQSLNPGFDERGLLGLAFHRDYANNRRFFVYYSAPLREGAPAGWNHTSHISEFLASQSDPYRADPASERIIMQVDQPQATHNAGALAFGPDGYLYISLGDGGGSGDAGAGHVQDWYEANEGGNAQNVTETLLGKILRIDVNSGDPYGIPPGNPFVGTDGLDEIFAYGLRNPYRMSFDLGHPFRLLAADAGQALWEEVNDIALGGNYGWNVKEGTHCFSPASPMNPPADCPDTVGPGHVDEGAPLRDPVIEYRNLNQEGGIGQVIIGGFVYQGTELPELRGRYVFGDWTSAGGEGRGLVFAANEREEGLWDFEIVRFVNTEGGDIGHYLLGFGQDRNGEMYVLATDQRGPSGTTGRIYRLAHPAQVSVEDAEGLPARVALEQNYPNPFNPRTSIRYHVNRPGLVTVAVYDLLGRQVAVLVRENRQSGTYNITWDGTDAGGLSVASGVYLYRITAGHTSETRKMVMVK